MIEPRILEVRTKILKKNDELAREMRDRFVDAGVLVSNLVSSPGTGKTASIEVDAHPPSSTRALTSRPLSAISKPIMTPGDWPRAAPPSARS